MHLNGGAISVLFIAHKNIIEMLFRLTRVQINGVRINEGPLYILYGKMSFHDATPPFYIRFWPLPGSYSLMVDMFFHIPMPPGYLVD